MERVHRIFVKGVSDGQDELRMDKAEFLVLANTKKEAEKKVSRYMKKLWDALHGQDLTEEEVDALWAHDGSWEPSTVEELMNLMSYFPADAEIRSSDGKKITIKVLSEEKKVLHYE